MCSNPFHLLTTQDILVSSEPYDASKSSIEVTLEVRDSEAWKTFVDMTNTVVKSFLKLYTCGKLSIILTILYTSKIYKF